MKATAIFPLFVSSHVLAIAIPGTETKAILPSASVDPDNLPPHALDVDYWCNTIDTTDPDSLIDLWETKGVGTWMGIWTQPSSNTEELGPDDWPLKIFKAIYPNAGNPDWGKFCRNELKLVR